MGSSISIFRDHQYNLNWTIGCSSRKLLVDLFLGLRFWPYDFDRSPVPAFYGPRLGSLAFSFGPPFPLTAASRADRRRRESSAGDLRSRHGDAGQRHAAREPPVQGPILLLCRLRPRLGQGPSRHGLPLLPRLALRRRPVRPFIPAQIPDAPIQHPIGSRDLIPGCVSGYGRTRRPGRSCPASSRRALAACESLLPSSLRLVAFWIPLLIWPDGVPDCRSRRCSRWRTSLGTSDASEFSVLCKWIWGFVLLFCFVGSKCRGGRAIGSKIVEAEMDLTKAKSEGYLWGNRTAAVDSDNKQKLLAVIGVYTGFGSRLKRNIFRGSWMPRGLLMLFFKFP